MRSETTARLLIRCPDTPGIVAAVSSFLYNHGANITALDQYSTDPEGGTFFMRLEFQTPHLDLSRPLLERTFGEAVGHRYQMNWRLSYAAERKKVALLVSKYDHALLELLQDQADLIVLARYMQILTADFVSRYPNRIINIHHSFLPVFVGVAPYRQAHERGVKLIGATAHYVTEVLDEGPIIEQDVIRVSHRHTVNELKHLGQNIERTVLARAVTWHLEDRLIVHGGKTVAFV